MELKSTEGKIVFKLDHYLKQQEIPRLRLSKKSGLDYRTVLRYCKSDVQNIKVSILESLCKTLDCKITDILDFEKDDNEKRT